MIESPCRKVNLKHVNDAEYKRRSIGCLILSQNRRIVLQQRDSDAPTFPDYIATFGGGVETGESPIQALTRELNEELGAIISPDDVISLGAISEPETNHTTLVYMYFWHDKHGSITGCYEGTAKYINDPIILDKYPKVMNDVIWSIQECKKLQLL